MVEHTTQKHNFVYFIISYHEKTVNLRGLLIKFSHY
jgi:hypothetical protein